MSRLAGAVLPLALAAAALALVAPSRAMADRSEALLALLVLLTALGIGPGDLVALRARWPAVLALSLVPLAVLAPAALLLSRLFEGPVRQGTLALGVAPTEVAVGGLAALAMGDAALALAVVAGSLVVSAIAGPLVIATLGGADVGGFDLLTGFALVVLVPLALGLGARAALGRLERARDELAGLAALVLAALVYAALSAADPAGLPRALLAGGTFLAVSAALALLWPRRVLGGERVTALLIFAMRDFAVAAGLAKQAFGAEAATVAGVYGVLMLLGGAGLAWWARRAAPP